VQTLLESGAEKPGTPPVTPHCTKPLALIASRVGDATVCALAADAVRPAAATTASRRRLFFMGFPLFLTLFVRGGLFDPPRGTIAFYGGSDAGKHRSGY